MATFNYGGVDLDLDWFILYARVSSPQQTLEIAAPSRGRRNFCARGIADIDRRTFAIIDRAYQGAAARAAPTTTEGMSWASSGIASQWSWFTSNIAS